jgi:hypothetical protein
LVVPLAFHLKDDLQHLKRRSYDILNHSKWTRIEKYLPMCSMIGVPTLPFQPMIKKVTGL